MLNLVAAVSGEAGSDQLLRHKRIATFDDDGTPRCEKPAYVQMFYIIERLSVCICQPQSKLRPA